MFLSFIDESGNAGANLLDKQPVFVITALTVKQDREEILNSEISKLKVKYGFAPEEELKGSELIKSKENKLMIEVAELILEEGQPILTFIVERRFMICALIVDNLLDPVYNSKSSVFWTYPSNLRRKLLEYFYTQLNDGNLELAATALTYGEEEALASLISTLVTEFSALPNFNGLNLSDLVSGAGPHVKALSEVIRKNNYDGIKNPPPGRATFRSPNLTSFAGLLMSIEDRFSKDGKNEIEILFDSSEQYNQLFNDLLELLKGNETKTIRFDGLFPIVTGFRGIKKFKAIDSRSSNIIQAADFLCVGVRKAIELALHESSAVDFTEAMKFFVAFLFVSAQAEMVNFVVSTELYEKFFYLAKRVADASKKTD